MIPVRRLPVTVPASSFIVVHATGDFLLVESATDNDAVTAFAESRNGRVLEGAPVYPGASYKRLPGIFDRIQFVNATAAAVDVVIWTGEGDVSLTLTPGSELASVRATGLSVSLDEAVVAGTNLDLEINDPDGIVAPVYEVHIQNDDGSANAVRFAKTAQVADAVGMKIQPGETYVARFDPTDLQEAWAVRNPTGGGAVTVRYAIIGRGHQ